MTRDTVVSVLPNSPVAIAALKTGRVVRKGMANKVSNFVALDPRDPRSGFANANALDKAARAQFFDPVAKTLDVDGIQREFGRLWPDDGLPLVASPPDPVERAADLEGVGLEELMKRWDRKEQQSGATTDKPKAVRATTMTFQREPLVVAIALRRAKHQCEMPSCANPLFPDKSGKPFLEVHHIKPLRDGGEDTPQNVAAICPSHHREAHHGQDAMTIMQALTVVRGAVTP